MSGAGRYFVTVETQETLRILHLEDTPADAELIGRQLRGAGLRFMAECVARQDAFVRALDDFHPDVVLADYVLPDFDGLAAIRLVRKKDADLPVIIVTGALGDEAAASVIKAGANDFVLKDRLARLAPAVERAVLEAELSRARRRAEEALRLSEERYRSLTVATAQIVWTTGARGEVSEDLPLWRTYTGQTVEAVKGAGWLNAIHPDERGRAAAAWAKAVEAGVPYETEWRLRRRDGEYRYFATRAAPVRKSDGAIREWIGCNTDITDRKHREEELQRLHAQMTDTLALLERRTSDMKALKNLSDALQACNSREEAYPFIAAAAGELFAGASGALAVPTPARDLLETVIEWGGARWMASDFAVEDCWALRRGKMHEPGPGTVCHHFKPEPDGPYVCLPLSVRGEASGLLTFRFAAGHCMDEDQQAAVAAFGDAVALRLSNLKLRESLQKQAIRDPLTGLLTSQYVDEALAREIRRVERHGESLSLVLLAVDHFRQLNDSYGQRAGDQVLREIGMLLPGAVGAFDIVCRYNAEQILLVLIDDEPAAALPRIREICLAIQQRSYTYQGQALPQITVSAGFAQLPVHGTTATEGIRAASQALCAARLAGPGRIEVYAGLAFPGAPAAAKTAPPDVRPAAPDRRE